MFIMIKTVLNRGGGWRSEDSWLLTASLTLLKWVQATILTPNGAVVVVIVWELDYNYLCNQCLSPLKLWVRDVLNTTLCDIGCHWLVTGRWFSLGTPVSSTNKTDRHDIAEILLKVALNIINPNPTSSVEVPTYLPITNDKIDQFLITV